MLLDIDQDQEAPVETTPREKGIAQVQALDHVPDRELARKSIKATLVTLKPNIRDTDLPLRLLQRATMIKNALGNCNLVFL